LKQVLALFNQGGEALEACLERYKHKKAVAQTSPKKDKKAKKSKKAKTE
jgi:hypothetical protein